MNVLIHCLDPRADVTLTSLVFLRPSFHLFSKPETSFQKSNTQSPNTSLHVLNSFKSALIRRFISRGFTQTSAWRWQRHYVTTKSSLVIPVCFVPS